MICSCCLQLGLVTQRTGLELNMNPINLHRTLCIVVQGALPDLQESADSGGGKGDWEKHDPFLHSKP